MHALWPVTSHSQRSVNCSSRLPVGATAGPQRLPAGQCSGHRQREPRPGRAHDALSAGACSTSWAAYVEQWVAWCIRSLFAVVARERHTGLDAPSSSCFRLSPRGDRSCRTQAIHLVAVQMYRGCVQGMRHMVLADRTDAQCIEHCMLMLLMALT